jgi:hypothetical protein
MGMNSIRDLIADDSYAMSFQSMGQYRTALLKALDQAVVPVSASALPWESPGFCDKQGRCWCFVDFDHQWTFRKPEPNIYDTHFLQYDAIPQTLETL